MAMSLETKEKWQNLLLNYKEYAPRFHKIVNKRGETVPFRMNAIQTAIDDKINELEAQGKPVRLIILKPRQPGVSTYSESKILHKCTTKKNRTGLVVAHTDASTNSVFNKTKFMFDNLPDRIKPMKKASNAQELIFDTPSTDRSGRKGLNSRVKIATAGGKSIGRGDTYHYVHLSEFAFFPGDIRAIFIGIMQAVPKTSDTMVIIESTAFGFNEYKEQWDKAVNRESEFVALFFAWHDHEEYLMPVTESEREEIMTNLSQYESNLVNTHGLSAERIKWYRWTLANDCAGDHNMMKQENPSNPDEAFLTTGTPVYDLEKVVARKTFLEKLYATRPPARGEFIFEYRNERIVDSAIKFIENPNGPLTIYERPQPKVPYVIGGDTAEGGIDPCVGDVTNNITGNQAAVWHMRTDTDLYAKQMYCLGKFYNRALIAIETNFDLHPVKELQRLKYPRQYKREVIDEITQQKQTKYGFATTSVTRPVIIGESVTLVRENVELINDIGTLNEMITFVRNEKGKPEAMAGHHDDRVLAHAISHKARNQQRMTLMSDEADELEYSGSFGRTGY